MNLFSKLLAVTLFLSSFWSLNAQAASFDCSKATTETEKAICADPELSALDTLMGYLWKQQKQISKARLQEQKGWLGERNQCGGDVGCLKFSYENRLKSTNFPQLVYGDYELVRLYDFSVKSFDQYFIAKGFGGSYNWTYYIVTINSSQLEVLPWLIPQFNENFETCNLNYINGQEMILKTGQEVHGWIETIGQADEASSEIRREITVFTKWVGHGDLSSEIDYRLNNGKFLPIRGKVDNCSDGKIKYSNINFENG